MNYENSFLNTTCASITLLPRWWTYGTACLVRLLQVKILTLVSADWTHIGKNQEITYDFHAPQLHEIGICNEVLS